MKTGTKVLIIAAGAALLLFNSVKNAISYLTYIINGVDISFDNLTPVLTLNIGIENPSNFSFTINSFVGTLTANGITLGNVSSFVPVQVNPASIVNYPLNIRLGLIGLASDIVNLIQKGSGISQTIELTGYVNANGIVAPFKVDYKIGL